MDLLTSKIISLTLLGVLSLFFGLIPLKIQKRLQQTNDSDSVASQKRQRRRRDLIVSCLLCFGAGVLMATVFLHMLPETRENVEVTRAASRSYKEAMEHLGENATESDIQAHMHSMKLKKMADRTGHGDDHGDHGHEHGEHDHNEHGEHIHKRSAVGVAGTTPKMPEMRNRSHDHDHSHGDLEHSQDHSHDSDHSHDHSNHSHDHSNHSHNHSNHSHDHSNHSHDHSNHSHDHNNHSQGHSRDVPVLQSEPVTSTSKTPQDSSTAHETRDAPVTSQPLLDINMNNDVMPTESHDHSHDHDHAHDHADHNHDGHLHAGHGKISTDSSATTSLPITQEGKADSSTGTSGTTIDSTGNHVHHGHDHDHDHNTHDHDNGTHDHNNGSHDHNNGTHDHDNGTHDHDHSIHDHNGKDASVTDASGLRVANSDDTHGPYDRSHTNLEHVLITSENVKDINNPRSLRMDPHASHSHGVPAVGHEHTGQAARAIDLSDHAGHDHEELGDHEHATPNKEHVHEEHAHAHGHNHDQGDEHAYPIPELLICLGFFFIYFVEEVVHKAVFHRRNRHNSMIDPSLGEGSMVLKNRHSVKMSNGTYTPTNIENGQVANVNGLVLGNGHALGNGTHESVGNGGALPPKTEWASSGVDNPVFAVENETSPNMANIPITNANVGHGHSHMADLSDLAAQSWVSNLRSLIVVVALSFHSVFEGLAVGLQQQLHDVWYLFYAIAAHKFVIAFCVGLELIVGGTKTSLTIIYMVVFAMVTPLGIAIGIIVTEGSSNPNSIPHLWTLTILQGLAGGTILYVTFCEVLERERSRKDGRFLKFGSLILGFATMAIIEGAGGHKHSH